MDQKETETSKAIGDALTLGTGIMRNGKRVDPRDFYADQDSLDILERHGITYNRPGHRLSCRVINSHHYITIQREVPDVNDARHPMIVVATQGVIGPEFADDAEYVADFVRRMLYDFEAHEVDEWLFAGGTRISKTH